MGTDEAGYSIRRAKPIEFGLIMSLLDEAVLRLADLGLDQWQGRRYRRSDHAWVDVVGGTVFLVEHRGRLVATITVDEFADADFWRPDDDVHSALYAHRMAVTRSAAGRGLGSAMLDWAAGHAQRCGRTRLRLDAWQTNGRLHVYYKNLGFEMVRNLPVAGRGSGALFERPAAVRDGTGPDLTDLVAARTLVACH